MLLIQALITGALMAGLIMVPSSPAAAQETYTYSVESSGDPETDVEYFAHVVRQTLTDDRGWNLGGGIEFVPVASDGDFQIEIASPEAVEAAHPVCSPHWSCRVGDRLLINDDNFRNATDAWTESPRDYQSYVINHEVGHWLGHPDYDDCPAGDVAPVMFQQSISLDGCLANVWPVSWERQDVSDMHGQPIVDRGAYPSPEGVYHFTGDWNGDGEATPGRFQDGTWELLTAHDPNADVRILDYGQAGDVPVVGDWNGDGTDTIGVVRGNTWILRYEYRRGADIVMDYGNSSDTPVTGDWNGDGRDTIGVVRGNTWILRSRYVRGANDIVMDYGNSSDTPVTGDWNGDGRDTLGVVRGTRWILRYEYRRGADIRLHYGFQVDAQVTGDFNADGTTTLGVVRDGHQWILRYAYRSGADYSYSW